MRERPVPLLAAILALLLLAAGVPPRARAQDAEPGAPYVPTPMSVVVEMLDLAGVTPADTVYDLGSGDGRLPITGARLYGARGFGVELDSGLVARSRRNARAAGVDSLVRFVRGDLFETDIRPASVLTLYLFPGMNERLRPRILRRMDPGDRVVAHDFSMGEWEADSVVYVPERDPASLELFDRFDRLTEGWEGFGGPEAGVDSLVAELNRIGGRATLYLWVIPADVGGTWDVSLPGGGSARIRLDQRFQELRAQAVSGVDSVRSARVRADSVELRLGTDGGTLRLGGTADGDRMEGRGAGGDGWSAHRVEDTDASILGWESAGGG